MLRLAVLHDKIGQGPNTAASWYLWQAIFLEAGLYMPDTLPCCQVCPQVFKLYYAQYYAAVLHLTSVSLDILELIAPR